MAISANEQPPVLKGVLARDLDVVFVAFEPGPTDISLRHHHARRNNQFWRLLDSAELTPRLLSPEEDESLTQFGLGLLSTVKRQGSPGSRRLGELMCTWPPRVLAYTGKSVYLAASGKTVAAWGRQPASTFEGVPDFVLPSPSGKVRMTFRDKLRYYQELAAAIRQG